MLNLKKLREQKKISQLKLANDIGVSRSTIAMWETERSQPDNDNLKLLSNYFNVSIDYLLGGNDKIDFAKHADDSHESYDNIFKIKKHRIPLLGEIACGQPIFASEDRESYVEAGTNINADFCLKAKGDSMINARILDGDIVFIREQPMVENGEIAAVIINNEATLKRVYYYKDEGKLILQAENPSFAPLMYVGQELNEVRILGKAIAFQSDVK